MHLLATLMLLSGLAAAETAKIVNCTTLDRPLTGEDLRERASVTEDSGVVTDDVEEAMRLLSGDLDTSEVFRAFNGKTSANVVGAKLITQRVMSERSVCHVFEGEVTTRFIISPETAPEPSAKPVALSPGTRFVIPVLTFAILERSAWTPKEVRARGREVRRALGHCGIAVKRVRHVKLANPGGKFDFLFSEPRTRRHGEPPNTLENALTEMIAHDKIKAPALLYLKNLSEQPNDTCSFAARALVRDHSVPRSSPAADLALINDHYAQARAHDCQVRNLFPRTLVDTHELGHVLLSDPGHSSLEGNVMSQTGPDFDEAQCALIRGSKYVVRTR